MESATTVPAVFQTFHGVFEWCMQQLRSNGNFCLISDILTPLGGDQGMAYLMQMFNAAVGAEVCAEYQPGADLWYVYLPKEMEPQLPFSVQLFTPLPEIPEQTTVSGGRKNPPRPMNCWLLYRDAHHKQLKATMPDLTVQEISTILSDQWKNLPAEKKDYWRAQAKLAKEEHQRKFPGYKYAPRKPGQKKKRQSRKARAAAAAASSPETSMAVSDFNAAPEATTSGPMEYALAMSFGPDAFDFNSFPDNAMLALDTDMSYFTADINNALPDDAAELADMLSVPISFEERHDAEALRHQRLQFEFEPHLSVYDDLEQVLAFEYDGGEDAILPEFFPEL